MKAWLLPQLGSIDSLRLVDDFPEPQPAGDEVVIELAFAALNPADRYLAEGQYPARPAMPHVLGRDGVGTVVAVGARVTSTKVGDVKLIQRGDTGVSRPGTFAERVAVKADELADVPVGWSVESAAGASLVYLTAYQAITQWGDLPNGEACLTLVTGASGGVGVAMVQLAKAMRHVVVGLSRSEAKAATLRELGIDLTLDPTQPTWPKRLAERFEKRKVNLAVDNVGGGGFNDLLNVMAYDGRISVVGRLAGPVPSFNTAMLFARRLRIGGVFVSTYTRQQADAAWREVVRLLANADQRPLVDRVFAFDQLPQAFARLHEGPMGKVVLSMKDEG